MYNCGEPPPSPPGVRCTGVWGTSMQQWMTSWLPWTSVATSRSVGCTGMPPDSWCSPTMTSLWSASGEWHRDTGTWDTGTWDTGTWDVGHQHKFTTRGWRHSQSHKERLRGPMSSTITLCGYIHSQALSPQRVSLVVLTRVTNAGVRRPGNEADVHGCFHSVWCMNCLSRRRRFNEAVTLLNKAVKEEKGEKGLYLNRGGGQNLQEWCTPRGYLHTPIPPHTHPHTHTHTPHHTHTLTTLSHTPDCFYRMNNLHFALADYQQALEFDQSDWSVRCRVAIVHCELGVECYGRGEHSEAEGHFTGAIRCNPKVSRFYLCRARARHELKVGG